MTGHYSRRSVGSQVFQAQAKLNIRLKVVGRRADGFHLLSMLNVRLALADYLRISLSEGQGVELKVTYSPDVARGFSREVRELCDDPQRNIASRAAELFCQKYCSGLSVKLELEKNIPAGGGLGGGSSDAATVLRALAEMTGAKVSQSDLLSLALGLGADVPYFLQDAPAWVGGIGDIVEPLNAVSPNAMPIGGDDCLLLLPPFELSTPAVYAKLREEMENFSLDSAFGSSLASRHDVHDLISNDLEGAAGLLRPELGALLKELGELRPEIAFGMTGSGSTVFALPRHDARFSSNALAAVEKIASAHRAGTALSKVNG